MAIQVAGTTIQDKVRFRLAPIPSGAGRRRLRKASAATRVRLAPTSRAQTERQPSALVATIHEAGTVLLDESLGIGEDARVVLRGLGLQPLEGEVVQDSCRSDLRIGDREDLHSRGHGLNRSR